MSAHGDTFRDGRVHVCRRMCATCVFRPGNLKHLRPGVLRSMIEDARGNDTAIICHSSLAHFGAPPGNAVCWGFYDRYPTTPLQLAQRLGLIEWVQR